MHSSRMRTAGSLSASRSIRRRGDVRPGGGGRVPGEARMLGGVRVGGVHAPPPWTERNLWKHNLHKLCLRAVMSAIFTSMHSSRMRYVPPASMATTRCQYPRPQMGPGTTPSPWPLNIMTDRCLWKHYLPVTTVGAVNIKYINILGAYFLFRWQWRSWGTSCGILWRSGRWRLIVTRRFILFVHFSANSLYVVVLYLKNRQFIRKKMF